MLENGEQVHEKDRRDFHDNGEGGRGNTAAPSAQNAFRLDLLSEASRKVQEEINIIPPSLKACRVSVGWEFGTLVSSLVFYFFLRWMLYSTLAESNHCTEKEPATKPDSTKFYDLVQATSLYLSLLGSKMDYRIVTRDN